MARWYSCNVLNPGAQILNLWQFVAKSDKFHLQREESKLPSEALPEKVVGKDWQTLFQPRLNIAWLLTDKVFLRVIQLPKSDFAEMQSMVELQLEKLSPLPVTQIVWGFELLPQTEGEMQTAIVIIIARSHIEEFLGELEGHGYLADRLELPFIDQLRATDLRENGVWIYPGPGTNNHSGLVAWWYDGTLRNLSLIHLPPEEDRQARLQEQLAHMNWAGELEGWLTSTPRYFLVADEAAAAEWSPLFTSQQTVQILPPLPAPDLAALTATRATREDLRTNLLPPEYAVRYRQRLVERLWVRGLGAILLIYLAGVVVYLGWVQYAKFHQRGLEKQMTSVGVQYTNTVQLRERVRVMQDQVDLQFAALNSYKAVAENLPPELTLDTLTFERGRKITLFGTAAKDDFGKVQDFNEALRKTTVKNLPLFSKLSAPNSSPRGNQMSWNFSCDIKQTEPE